VPEPRSSPPQALLAVGAVPAKGDFVVGGEEPEPVGQLVDRAFEGRILERDELAALVADEMMVVVLPVGVGGLVPSDPVAEVESVHEVVRVQELQDPVDTRPPDSALAAAAAAQGVFDLDRAECAVLSGEQVDDSVACRSAMVPGTPEYGARMVAPIAG
jgi:hypothetical protein